MTNSVNKTVIHIEVRLLPAPNTRQHTLVEYLSEWIKQSFSSLAADQEITMFDYSMHQIIERATVSEISGSTDLVVPVKDAHLEFHVYQLHSDNPVSTSDAEGQPTSRIIKLPARSLDGLWESLIFQPDIKTDLLNFVSTLALFSRQNVDFVSLSFNRLIILHGPPGSGKTSLARALAQKLSIRFSSHYKDHKLVEINSHNLFSKYFAESSRLVMALIEEILTMLADPAVFTVVLIDEVETLICARKATATGSEPSDSLRVVTALLTGLDRLRLKNNVLVITTSNLIEAMDPAFLDRADVTQFVGLPETTVAYSILRNSLSDLSRAGIIVDKDQITCSTEARLSLYSDPDSPSSRLWRCAKKCVGFSGRMLGKLPVLMHASHLRKEKCNMLEALVALERTIENEIEARARGDSGLVPTVQATPKLQLVNMKTELMEDSVVLSR